jgi:hypothetical protein
MRFKHGDDTTPADVASSGAQCASRIFLMHQHKPSHDCIDGLTYRHCFDVHHAEVSVLHTALAGPGGGNGDGLARTIDAEHVPRRPDQLCCQETDVAHATADVEHPHPSGYARFLEKQTCDALEEVPLGFQAFELGGGMPAQVQRMEWLTHWDGCSANVDYSFSSNVCPTRS